MNKLLHLDIESVKAYGVENWHSNFSWPVSMEQYSHIAENIMTSFLRVQKLLPQIIKDAFMINYSDFNSGLTLYIHHNLILREKSADFIYSKDKNIYHSDLKKKFHQIFTGII